MRVKPPTAVDHIRDVLQGAVIIVIGITVLVIAVFMFIFTFNLVRSGIIWLANNWFK